MADCSNSIGVDQSPSSASIDRIEAYPGLYRTAGRKVIRIEPSPIYGKLMQYLFPRWKNSKIWLARKLEFVRHHGCSPMAQVGNAYIVVRHSPEVQKRVPAQLIITKSAAEVADWKELDEILCDGPLVVEEIR